MITNTETGSTRTSATSSKVITKTSSSSTKVAMATITSSSAGSDIQGTEIQQGQAHAAAVQVQMAQATTSAVSSASKGTTGSLMSSKSAGNIVLTKTVSGGQLQGLQLTKQNSINNTTNKLPRTLSTSVLRIKHKSSFWDKLENDHGNFLRNRMIQYDDEGRQQML